VRDAGIVSSPALDGPTREAPEDVRAEPGERLKPFAAFAV